MAVETGADFDVIDIDDGAPHQLDVLDQALEINSHTIVVAPDARQPPFALSGANRLNLAPLWARRSMFAHASPAVALVGIDGGSLDGTDLVGRKRLVVYWDHGQTDRDEIVEIIRALNRAQAGFRARDVEAMLVHTRFPAGRREPLSNDDLRALRRAAEEVGNGGSAVQMFRFPNELETHVLRSAGLERAFSVSDNLRESPAVVLLDERGIVRWHSDGLREPTVAAVGDRPKSDTIDLAIDFCLSQL